MRGARAFAGIMAVTGAMALAACGDDDDGGTAPATTTAGSAAAGASGVDAATVEYGVRFTGGTAGKADESLEPLEIGFVNQQGGTPGFPEQEGAADAAVAFVNANLGGVQGHPIKLVKCFVLAEEDGQKCAAELLNKGVKVANLGLGVVGNPSFYKAVNGRFPVLLSVGSVPEDYSSPHVYEMDAGGASIIGAMSTATGRLGAKKAVVVSSNNAAGKFVTANVLLPGLKQQGISAKAIYVSDTATTPDFASALQAGGGSGADVVLLVPPSSAQCISTYDAMKQLAIDVPVITTYFCAGEQFVKHTNGGAPNWYTYSFTGNERVVDEESKVFVDAMTAYGAEKWIHTGSAIKGFGDILLLAKLANGIGYDALTPAAFEKAMKEFPGPAFMVPGTFGCGRNETLPSACGDTIPGSTFKDGAWQAVEGVKVL